MAGRFLPQLGQKFDVTPFCPQSGQSQPASIAGRFLPQLGQKFDVTPFCPQSGQSQPSGDRVPPRRWAICAAVSITGFNASFAMPTTLPIAPSVTPRPAISPSPPSHTTVAAKAVLHGFEAHLTGRLLLVGKALHAHLFGFGRDLHAVRLRFGLLLNLQRFSFALCADDSHLRLGLCLHGLAACGGLGLALANLLLPDAEVLLGKLLLHPAEIGIVVRRDHAADKELRDLQPVFGQTGIDLLAQRLAQLHQPLVDLEHADAPFADGCRQKALHLRHHHRAEKALAAAEQVVLLQRAGGTHHAQKQLAGVGHADIHLAARAQLHVQSARRVKQAHLAVRAPLQAQLGGQIDEVNLRMEGALGVGGQFVELLQDGQLLRLERITARAKGVQRLSVAEEHGLLTLVDNQLGAEVEVLDGMLPHQRLAVALVPDDAGETVPPDILSLQTLGDIVFKVAHRTNVRLCTARRAQPHAALATGEFCHPARPGHGIDRLAADGTSGVRALRLIEHHVVAAMRTGAARHPVRADVDGIAAGTVDLPAGQEARLCFHVLPASGTFDDKSGHTQHSLSQFILSEMVWKSIR